MSYAEHLRDHLARYKRERLGLAEDGVWRRSGRAYPHILPGGHEDRNLLETIREPCWRHLRRHPEVKLHGDFAHMNSSQAMAFNLFFPFFGQDAARSEAFLGALGCPLEPVAEWAFERVLDPAESTNLDFYARLTSGPKLLFEVKLSESEFGRGAPNSARLHKLDAIYAPRLRDKIAPSALEPERFFAHYQILRNVSYADPKAGDRVFFVFPRANEALAHLEPFLDEVLHPEVRAVVQAVHLEDLVEGLASRTTGDPTLADHLAEFREKYLPAGAPELSA